jgi:hypothetical protein
MIYSIWFDRYIFELKTVIQVRKKKVIQENIYSRNVS